MSVKYSHLKVTDVPRLVSKTETLTIKIIADFTQTYLGSLNILLNGACTCDTALLTYLIHVQEEDKLTFINEEKLFTNFSEYLKQYKKEYSKISFKKSLVFLEKFELIIRIERARYMLNPLHFWRGRKEDRIEEIVDLYKKGKIKVIDSDIKLTETGV